MPIKRPLATRLRAKVFRTPEEVIATGEAVDMRRPGGAVHLVPRAGDSRLVRLQPHPGCIVGDAAELAELSWPEVWRPTL